MKIGNTTTLIHGEETITPSECITKIKALELFTGKGEQAINWDTVSLQSLLRKMNGGFQAALAEVGKDNAHKIMMSKNDLYRKLADKGAFIVVPDWFIQKFSNGQTLLSEEWLGNQLDNIALCYSKVDADVEWYHANYLAGCFFLLCRIYGKEATYLPTLEKMILNTGMNSKVTFRRHVFSYFFAEAKGWTSKKGTKTSDHHLLKKWVEKFKPVVKNYHDANVTITQAQFNAAFKGSTTSFDKDLTAMTFPIV